MRRGLSYKKRKILRNYKVGKPPNTRRWCICCEMETNWEMNRATKHSNYERCGASSLFARKKNEKNKKTTKIFFKRRL